MTWLVVVLLLASWPARATSPTISGVLERFVSEAKKAGLPTRFIEAIPADFVTVEFDDLHAFAAEYHLDDHRLVLNQALSFNGAGGTLKGVAKLAPRELGTVYHELFHAYLDYLLSRPQPGIADPSAARLVQFAHDQRQCRYQHVTITPILQRKGQTETRFLTERESWEALHETWAVFVGWSIRTKTELQRSRSAGSPSQKNGSLQQQWIKRLITADRNGELIGYYEPEQEEDRAVTHKRYLAPSHRIAPAEVQVLLEDVLEYPADQAGRIANLLKTDHRPLPGSEPCPVIPARPQTVRP